MSEYVRIKFAGVNVSIPATDLRRIKEKIEAGGDLIKDERGNPRVFSSSELPGKKRDTIKALKELETQIRGR